jgi:hypothetical protein
LIKSLQAVNFAERFTKIGRYSSIKSERLRERLKKRNKEKRKENRKG